MIKKNKLVLIESEMKGPKGHFLNNLIGFPPFILAYIVGGGQAYLTEGRQKRMIKGAFAQYLSPDMVDSLILDPEKLKLGGERRKMSIMFCDVRGFTAISEALKETPEKLTEIINILLTNLTRDILEFNGTVDKYMGDCIMAFWNAPLEDDKHASNSVEAAKKMMKTIYKVNDKIQFDISEVNKNNITPNKIELNIVHEDNDLLVINKPKGLVVHPGAGNYKNTLANGLVYKYKKNLTIYNFDYLGITSKYKKFSLNWWKKRGEAFDFMKILMKKMKLKFIPSLDYFVTKVINFFI